MTTRWIGLLTLLLAFGCAEAAAQAHRVLPVEDGAYDYLRRLQRRGHLLDLNPTALPYRYGEVADALAALDREKLSRHELRWVAWLERAVRLVPIEADEFALGGSIEVVGRITDSERLDPLRPLGDTINVYPIGLARFWMEAGPVAVETGTWHDRFYEHDPDGLDAVLRGISRSENAYAGLDTRLASLYLGRFSHHWSMAGEAAIVLSNNARTFDKLALRLGGERLAVRSILGELDSVTDDGRFTGRVADDSEQAGHRRRFLAAHRWDWRPTPQFTLALLESAIYSGPSSNFSLKYLNPLHPFILVVDNVPKNDENNGFFGGLLWWQYRDWTLHGQLLLDDIDLLNADEPTSFALTGSLVYAAPAVDVGGTLTLIAARTYNTGQPEGKYLFLLRGLATQFSDYVHAVVFADVYLDDLAPGLRVTPRLDLLWQGEQDIRAPFPGTSDAVAGTILTGVVERTLRPAAEVLWQPCPWFWLRLDGGVNVVANAGHVEGASKTRFSGVVSAGLRIALQGAYRLSF